MYRLRASSFRLPASALSLFLLLGLGGGVGQAEVAKTLAWEDELSREVRSRLVDTPPLASTLSAADSAVLEAAWRDVADGDRPAAWRRIEPIYARGATRFATVEDLAYAAAVESQEAQALGGASAPSSAGRMLSDEDYAALLSALAVQIGDRRTAARLVRSASPLSSPALQIQQARLAVDRAPAAPETYRVMAALEEADDLTPSQVDDVRSLSIEWSLRYAEWADWRHEGDSAIRMLEWARGRFPTLSEINLRLAWAYLDQSRPLRALELVREMRRSGSSLELCAVGAMAGMQAGDAAAAGYWTRRGLQAAPSDPTMLILAARHAQLVGDGRQAEAYWHIAAQKLAGDMSPSAAFRRDASNSVAEPSSGGRIRIFGLASESIEIASRPTPECGASFGAQQRNYCIAGLDATDQRM